MNEYLCLNVTSHLHRAIIVIVPVLLALKFPFGERSGYVERSL